MSERTLPGMRRAPIVWPAVVAVAVLSGAAARAQTAEPPHPILSIPGTGSRAEAILATYTEQQFLEFVPLQSPRNPDLSSYGAILVAGDTRWSWSAASPNQLVSLPSGTVFPNPTYPTTTHDVAVLSGKTVQITKHQDLQRTRSAFVHGVIDFHKRNALRGFLSELAAAYVLSGQGPETRDDRYARRIAIALDLWAHAVPDYYMTGKNSGSFISADGFTQMTTDIQRASSHNGLAHEWQEGELRAFDAIHDSRALAALSVEKGYDVRRHIATNLFGNIGDFIVQRAPVSVAIKSNLSEPFIVLATAARVLNRPDWMPWLNDYLEETVSRKIMRDGVLGESPSYSYGYVRKNRDIARNIRDYFLTRPADTPLLQQMQERIASHVKLLEFGLGQWDAMRLPDNVTPGFGDTQFGGSRPPGAGTSHLLPAYGMLSLGAGEGAQAVELTQSFSDDANHQRADVTAFVLYAMSSELLGNIRYFNGTPGRNFGEQILSHNAVTIDRSNMSRGTWAVGGSNHRFTSGNLTLHEPGNQGLAVSEVDGQRAYANRASRYQRLMLLNTADADRPYVLDVFRVTGGRTHDYTLHGAIRFDQTWESSLPLVADPAAYPMLEGSEVWTEPTSSGSTFPYYGFWRDVSHGPAVGDFHVTYRDVAETRRDLRLWVTDPGPNATVSLGRTPIAERTNDEPPDYYKYWRPSLILRRRIAEGTLESLFVGVVEPLRGGVSAIQSVERIPLADPGLDGVAVRITFADGRTDVCLVNLHNPRVAGAASGGPTVATADGGYVLAGRIGVHTSGPLGERAWTVAASDFRFAGARLATPNQFYQGTVTEALRKVTGASGDAFVTATPLPAGGALRGRQLSLAFDTYRVVPLSSGVIQRGISEMFEIDHVEGVNGGSHIHFSRDHQLVMAGGRAVEQMAPERTFEGPFSFEIGLSASVVPISPLADRAVGANEAVEVAFTLDDLLSTPAGQLTVAASSSNPAVVPEAGLVLGGGGAFRTLTVIPAPDVNGRSVITVAASDGLNTISRRFTLTVGVVDDPPTISRIDDRTIGTSASTGPIPFTIGDASTPAAELQVRATSSDSTLVPAEGLLLAGTGADRSITVVPAPGRSGRAVITVEVSDGGSIADETFTVVIDDPPRLSPIADRVVPAGGSTGPIPFTVADGETAAELLTIVARSSNPTLVPLGGLAVGGSGVERTLTVTPAASQAGASVITLTVGDGLYTTSVSFTLTVDARPLLSAINDRTIPEDGTTGPIPFTATDRETAPGALSPSALSSNPDLVPNEAIVIRSAVNPWTSADVGAVAAAGSSVAGDVFTIRASGADLWSTADEGHLVYQDGSGDGELVARIRSLQQTNEWAKAGVMFRTTSHPSSPNVAIVVSASRGIAFQRRATQAGTSTSTVVANIRPPAWVRLVKTGSTFTGYYALDGAEGGRPGPWVQVGTPLTVELGERFLQGLAVTSHQDGSVTTAVLDNVSGTVTAGGSHSVTVTPAADRSGTAVITLSAADGLSTTTSTFTVTVTPVNDAPQISALADRTVSEDTSTGPLAFTIGDAETEAAALAVAVSSSDPDLVPTAGLVLSGDGAERTLLVEPAANRSGTAVITVSVSDGGATAERAFILTVLAENDRPIVTGPGAVTIDEDEATVLPFQVADVETPAEALAITVTSSAPELVPADGIVLQGSGADRSVRIVPAANASGTAVITLAAADGTDTGTTTFPFTVTPVNDAPTIADVADQRIGENRTAGPIPFDVDDVDHEPGRLTLAASSSNPALVGPSDIVFGGSGRKRTVTIRPQRNRRGTATITLTVGDGVVTASDALVLRVEAVPTLSRIGPQIILEDRSTGPIRFRVRDADTEPEAVTVAATSSNTVLLPTQSIVLGGSGTDRMITLTPAPNASGLALVTLTATDGASTARSSFLVVVIPVNDRRGDFGLRW